MSYPPIGPDDLGRGHDAARRPSRRRGAPPSIAVLTRGWATALAALALGGAFLAGPPRPEPAHPIGLGGTGGILRALTFDPDGGVLAAVETNGAVMPWRVDAARGWAEPVGPGAAGFRAPSRPGGRPWRSAATRPLRSGTPRRTGRAPRSGPAPDVRAPSRSPTTAGS
jgi:hypothetical protein